MYPKIAPPARIATPLSKVAGEYFIGYDSADGGWDILLRSPDFTPSTPVIKVFIDETRVAQEDYLGNCVSRVRAAMEAARKL
ncbi:hypothetical protein B842_12535 [Corynebacterium humireducens NBRC 106098 = DSM 45392]|uniref:Uncharacterized protein n=1 Tax=Corynebacterium humireducens NBRC 106098 = DSM 45392 TaxID=1223515 RepID=A0A0B5DBN2_9CORY|nr:hypothetical protein [Corynebacterium humireducens]AJE34352.1 hypothetical protein B842_12535 [Corynebacterium humireducens NBRC 106098 = DSM 45392]